MQDDKNLKFAERCLKKLAYGKTNDVFKLIEKLEDEDSTVDISKLDLMNISEFKKGKDGYSVKFFDRQSATMAILQMYSEMNSKNNSQSLYNALIGGDETDD